MFDPNKDVVLWAIQIYGGKSDFSVYTSRASVINRAKQFAELVDGDLSYKLSRIPDSITIWKLKEGKWVDVELVREYIAPNGAIIKDQV